MTSATNIVQANGRTVRILIADPHDDTRTLYRESLRLTGCEVVDAADGRDALVKALSQPPTLVITETWLPILSGYALCEVLRSDAMTRTVPILVVTADARPTERNRAHDAGADAVLIKPVTPEALLNEIQRLLRAPAKRPDESSTPKQATARLSKSPRRTSAAETYRRFETKTPPAKPPDLLCPSCDTPLVYECSHVGGVNHRHPEQWDDYRCPACGPFVYRQRTRQLREAI